MKTRPLLLLTALGLALRALASDASPAAGEGPGAQGWRYEEIRRVPAAEARQGVAVDAERIVAISNHDLGSYRRDTGERLGTWSCPEGEPLTHLNAGLVHDGKLYCAHSNFPGVPMTSSVEMWDLSTMRHVGSHSFGRTDGSLTWFVRREGKWVACFVHYARRGGEPGRGPEWTRLEEFDDDWRPTGRGWAFPPALLHKLATRGFSVSGGALGPGGFLFVTGHDDPELHVLEFPSSGPALHWRATIPMAPEGQAVIFDPADPQVLWGLVRRTREIVAGRLHAPPAAAP